MNIDKEKFDKIVNLIEEELERASDLFGGFNSMHEGHSVIQEEFDELWDEIKCGKNMDVDNLKVEATQLAAVVIRFIYDFCED